jgi:hypothetical protein
MSEALAVLSKAKQALAKAGTFDEVNSIRVTAKAVKDAMKEKYSPKDVRRGLAYALEARDRSLEAGGIELLAEYKAGTMLASLRTEKAGVVPENKITQAQACRDAEVSGEVAKFWVRLVDDNLTEEQVNKYVEFVQNSTDPAILQSGVSIQGFRKFILGNKEAAPKEARHDWAVMLLTNGTEEALDSFVEISLKVATALKKECLKKAKQGILDEGLIPRGKK